MLTTTYANLDKLAVEHFTTCAAGIMLGNEGDAGTVTVALDDEPRDRSRPDITARVQDLLVYARALSPTAQVDKEFEEVRKFLAKLPRDEWVPCSDGDRHDELGRVEDAYDRQGVADARLHRGLRGCAGEVQGPEGRAGTPCASCAAGQDPGGEGEARNGEGGIVGDVRCHREVHHGVHHQHAWL